MESGSDNQPRRLQTSAERITTLRKELAAEIQRRDQLIVQMVDDGYQQSAVRRWAGFKNNSSITHLLARPVHQHMIVETEVRK